LSVLKLYFGFAIDVDSQPPQNTILKVPSAQVIRQKTTYLFENSVHIFILVFLLFCTLSASIYNSSSNSSSAASSSEIVALSTPGIIIAHRKVVKKFPTAKKYIVYSYPSYAKTTLPIVGPRPRPKPTQISI